MWIWYSWLVRIIDNDRQPVLSQFENHCRTVVHTMLKLRFVQCENTILLFSDKGPGLRVFFREHFCFFVPSSFVQPSQWVPTGRRTEPEIKKRLAEVRVQHINLSLPDLRSWHGSFHADALIHAQFVSLHRTFTRHVNALVTNTTRMLPKHHPKTLNADCQITSFEILCYPNYSVMVTTTFNVTICTLVSPGRPMTCKVLPQRRKCGIQPDPVKDANLIS